MTASIVPRVSAKDLGPAGFARYVAEGRPVVLTDFAEGWAATRSLAPKALAERHGDVVVSAMGWQGDRIPDGLRYAWVKDRLGTWLDRLSSNESTGHLYAAFPLPALGAEVMKDLAPLGPWLAGARGKRRPPELWLNGARSVTPVHFGVSHALVVQLHGHRAITLYAPEDAAFLGYPDPATRSFGPRAVTFLSLDLDAPNHAQLPRFGQARPAMAEVGPGDAVFLPSRWVQLTRHPELSVAVSQFWSTPGTYLKNLDVFARTLVRKATEPARAG
jgi:hypothetical protein